MWTALHEQTGPEIVTSHWNMSLSFGFTESRFGGGRARHWFNSWRPKFTKVTHTKKSANTHQASSSRWGSHEGRSSKWKSPPSPGSNTRIIIVLNFAKLKDTSFPY